jgi:pantoate--beta-alanine ligase
VDIIKEPSQIIAEIQRFKKSGKIIGFVPTMGALHRGHLSLIEKSKKNTDVTVVSIFVNPTQFNDKNDLANYPRTVEADSALLEKEHCDILFLPTEKQVYPEPDKRVFDFGNLDKVMEGASRPGHFNGVAQVVSRFFDLIQPDKAFFGEKDFQQLAIIKQLVKILNFQVEIVPCPIVREPDGLAMSSRNSRLNADQRKSAVQISQTLLKSVEMAKVKSVQELKTWVMEQIGSNQMLKTEYFEISDDTFLQPVKNWSDPSNKVGCVAVKVGNVRLIDNIRF